MSRIRTEAVLTSLVAMLLVYQLQPGVMLNADAMAVSVVSRPAGPTRIARAVVWGLMNPFRSKPTADTAAAAAVAREPQVYNLGMHAVQTTQVNNAHAGHVSTAASTLRAGDIAVRTVPSRRRVRLRRVNDVISPTTTMTSDYTRTIPAPIKIDLQTDSITKTETSVQSNSLIGSLVQPFQACLDPSGGDIDLDRLLNACKKYTDAVYTFGQKAMGENLKQNLKTIETAKAQAPRKHQSTVRKLLEYEKAHGVRQDGGKLKNGSAAMSLLWIRRSLAFQHRLNECLVEHPDVPTPQAAMHAYEQEVQPFHSWGLQKLFKMTLRSSTAERPKTLAQLRGSPFDALDPIEEARTIEELRSLDETWEPLLSQWKSIFETLDLEDDSKA